MEFRDRTTGDTIAQIATLLTDAYPNVADDPTDSYTEGRYLVRFDGALSRTYRLGRQESSLRLIEIE
ncbi:MAG: hypothetical protein IH602_11470 [Bryobacteraceae bacterium]|nr:hypothetical protein [Bryobacteraceae bacterium]